MIEEKNQKICEYEGCNEPINPHYPDSKYCIFHAPKEEKGISVEDFNLLIINEKLKKKDYNFRGFVFPGKISFSGREFDKAADFSEATFSGEANFSRATFSEVADFGGAKFSGWALFREATFSQKADFSEAKFLWEADFREATFSKEANFIRARFSIANFNGAKFSVRADFRIAKFSVAVFMGAKFSKWAAFNGATFSEVANFNRATFYIAVFMGAKFSKKASFGEATFSLWADFSGATFSEEADFFRATFSTNADFTGATFSEVADFSGATFSGEAKFLRATFSGDTRFIKTIISGDMYFTNILVKERTIFRLRDINFELKKNSDKKTKPIRIIFDHATFSPFNTHFEGIKLNKKFENPGITEKPVLIFRYCNLKDVYFANNNLSLFSFYKSSFDQARFVSNKYEASKIILFKRENIIFEELIFPHLDNKMTKLKKVKDYYYLKDLESWGEIASLYRRMKTALDNTKDFDQSGAFYFNEFEMKKKNRQAELKKEGKIKAFFGNLFGRAMLYRLYKIFAGYGEKPLWSFLWLLAFLVIIFPLLNLGAGLQTDIPMKDGFLSNYWHYSLPYTFFRLIPQSYIPFKFEAVQPAGNTFAKIFSVLNTIILYLFAIFTAMGLKRRFHRY